MAKAPEFVSLVDELAAAVAAKGEDAAAERQDEVDQLAASLKENISVGRVVRVEAGDGRGARHLPPPAGRPRGERGRSCCCAAARQELAHDVAVHVAFARPAYLRREDVPEADVAAERATVEEISRNEGKPEAALPKIVEGRMNGWFKERCLLEQPYVKDEKKTVAALLGPAEVVRFAQVVIGA